MFRILPRTPLSSRRLSALALALALFLLPAAVQALPAAVPVPAAAPAPAAGPLETAWAWLVRLFAADEPVATRETPVDQLDGTGFGLPIFFEGSHLDPNGGGF